MKVYAGIDGGSTYIKGALVDENANVLAIKVVRTGIDNDRTAKTLLAEMCEMAEISRIEYIMATGYSRKVLEIAQDDVSEITAHAYGARITAPKECKPCLIIDIGGQDSKVIYLDETFAVKNFTMNDKCAAGTGKFLEVAANILETEVEHIGTLSLNSKVPCDINSTCVVFAQSEIISLIARKQERQDILAGMHYSMARRIVKMIKKSEVTGDILMTGGCAKNVGLHSAFEHELMRDIFIAKHPQFNGAIGAALVALRR